MRCRARPRWPAVAGCALAASALAAAALAACTSDADDPVPRPTPYLPAPSAATGTAGSTGPGAVTGASPMGGAGLTGALPTGPTAARAGNLDRGVLSVHVSDPVDAERTLRQLISAVYSPPPGGIALVWTAGGTDPSTVGIGGSSFVGTQPTAPTLRMTITVPSSEGGLETFVSLDGECSVTLDEAAASAVSGSFRCTDLRSANGMTANASGTFSASGSASG